MAVPTEQGVKIVNSSGVQLLDCTIRDGGYVLGWDQSWRYVRDLIKMCDDSKIEYCEIGFINEHKQDSGWWDALKSDTVKSIMTDSQAMASDVKLVAMLDFGKNTIQGLEWLRESTISVVRIAVRIEQLEQAMEFATLLTNTTGVNCCINVMQLSVLTNHEILLVGHLANKYRPWGVYFADSFGACFPKRVKEAVSTVANLNIEGVRVGFHGHNNLQLAFANSLVAIEAGATMIDSTVTGVGRGGGNLPTELAVGYWRGSYESSHVVEFYEKYMSLEVSVGVLHRALATGLMNAHPNYGMLPLTANYGNFLHALSELPSDKKRKFLRHAFDRVGDDD